MQKIHLFYQQMKKLFLKNEYLIRSKSLKFITSKPRHSKYSIKIACIFEIQRNKFKNH